MGLQKNASTAQWIGLSRGQFTIKNGETVENYAAFSGLLVGIGFLDKKKYQSEDLFRQMVLTFQCGDQLYKIGLDSRNGYSRSIKMKLPNVDLTREFELVPKYNEEKKEASCFINQGGVGIRQKWTRDNPGDLPSAESAKLGGKTVWSFDVQEKWLEQYLLDHVAPIAAANLVRGGINSSEALHHEPSEEHHSEDGSGIPVGDEAVPF